MKYALILVPLVAFGLTGCSFAMKDQAIASLKAQCAAKGMQFVQTDSKQTELLVVSQAQVSGECVGPGDPRYVAPASSGRLKPSV
jgi:hypothetical protein